MITVTFIEPGGDKIDIQVEPGNSLMSAAFAEGVEGILAECGGACVCATCHVVVEDGPAGALTEPEEQEQLILEGAMDVTDASRLSCQITAKPELDGLVLRVPEAQY